MAGDSSLLLRESAPQSHGAGNGPLQDSHFRAAGSLPGAELERAVTNPAGGARQVPKIPKLGYKAPNSYPDGQSYPAGRGLPRASAGGGCLGGAPASAPHLIPIWGAWVDDRWYVEGGPTRWQRNLRENPRMAIHVEFGDEVVIVEGVASELVAPAPPLSDAILAGYAKYKDTKGYEASASSWTDGGLWELRPLRAFAWSTFPRDATRFRFDSD